MIDKFIKAFNHNAGTRCTFLYGCCYWFAYILKGRFPEGQIYYVEDPDLHFIFQYEGHLWDITGDVTDLYYDASPWEDFPDELRKQRIYRDCINIVNEEEAYSES